MCLHVNSGMTKVMISLYDQVPQNKSGKFPWCVQEGCGIPSSALHANAGSIQNAVASKTILLKLS